MRMDKRDDELAAYGLERVPARSWSERLWIHNLSWVDDDCTKPVRVVFNLDSSEYRVDNGSN